MTFGSLMLQNSLQISLVVFVLFPGVALSQSQASKSIDDFLPSLSESQELNVRTPDTFGSGPVKWSLTCDETPPCNTNSGMGFLRLRIRAETQVDTSWSLTVFNAAGQPVDILPADLFRKEAVLWTSRVVGRMAKLELKSDSSLAGLRLVIDKINYSHFDPEPKAIIGKNDLQDLVLAYGRDHRFYTWSHAVPVIFFQTLITEKDTDCTGVMLTPSLLLTNHHCISQPKQLRTAYVQFGYETNSLNTESFQISEIVLTDETLDFSLLRLDRPASEWSTAQADSVPIKKNRKLVIIQYPNGSRKKVSAIGCEVESPEVTGVNGDFFHFCDADGGTSGAPVMDRLTGKVLGLHHIEQWNYKKKQDQNRAVMMEPILNKIRQCKPKVLDEITSAIRHQ
jgi:V8-like Glu-specific endopeptidase